MKLFQSFLIPCILLFFISCQNETKDKLDEALKMEFPKVNQKEASLLVENPLQCIDQKYPYKTSVVYNSDEDVKVPSQLHPSFYGCFDWHSAVHGHWSLIVLLKNFPDLPEAHEVIKKLTTNLSKENIEREVEFFSTKNNSSFERTYGWAWLFQLATELHSWENEKAVELLENLTLLVKLLQQKTEEFLPKLNHPIRVGEHSNTAFALNLMLDYAIEFEEKEFENLIKERALLYYDNDIACPLSWEPSGFDFLSPCLEEARLMSKIHPNSQFNNWLEKFLPELLEQDFYLTYAKVSDREDGKLVHLDGLNFSRAWNLYELSKKNQSLEHLEEIGDFHFIKTYPNLFGDSYEGAHWLGSFALYALEIRKG